jgi:thioredoxin reductase
LVLTSPVELPIYGKFRKTELSKEELLSFWQEVLNKVDFKFRGREKVEEIKKGEDGIFTVMTAKSAYRARSVVLAIGKAGTPRKLGVKGEELPKVMYRLIETDHYRNRHVLVVGGGDSAVEAAMGLANQAGNKITLSYRRGEFTRLRDRNEKRLEEYIRDGRIRVIYNSNPVQFTERSAILGVRGKLQEIPNDFAWIFAGGEPPTAFLKKVGIKVGIRDMTSEGSSEAKLNILVHS